MKFNFSRTALVLCCSVLISLTAGCKGNSNETEKKHDYTNHLHFDMKGGNPLEWSDGDFLILREAYDRVGDYIVKEDGKWSLTIKSGKDVNISDELFTHISISIQNLNEQVVLYNELIEAGVEIDVETFFGPGINKDLLDLKDMSPNKDDKKEK